MTPPAAQATPQPAPAPPASPAPPAAPRTAPWLASVACGVAVLLAAGPVSAVVRGNGWLAYASGVVAAVVGVGVLTSLLPARRTPPVGVAAVQVAVLFGLLTLLFTEAGPGVAAFAEMADLLVGAGAQIDVGIAPVAATPEILFLVTASVGLLSVAVHLAVVGAGAPAVAGVPLLAAFAVPAALADGLLPWWALIAAAAGFGLLLLAPDGQRRQVPGGIVLVAGAAVLALLLGSLTAFVGTSGRFDGGGDGAGSGSIGLSPFTALRGQLDQSTPTPLFQVRGLPDPTYLRALTLSDYQPGVGWRATQPAPGAAPEGPFTPPAVPGTLADVDVQNVGFRDYWLPVYGAPLAVTGLSPGRYRYDEISGIGYADRPAEQNEWRQSAFLPAPTTDVLRGAQGSVDGSGDPAAIYSNVLGVDPRVTELANEVTAGAPTDFDRALALTEWFTGPDSEFTYDLATAPPAGDDALVEFLTVGRVGYCEQFASAMAVMLRAVGVPARVAVGFTAGSPVGDYRAISTDDAHAWVEAWFPGVGWTTFDPTPLTDGRTVVPPYVEQARSEAAAGQVPTAPAVPPPAAPAPAPTAAPTAPEQAPEAAPVEAAPAEPGLPVWPFLVAASLVLVALVPAALRLHRRRTRLTTVAAGGAAAVGAAWDELLAESTDRGVPVPASDTVRGAARRLVREHRLDPAAQDALRRVVTAVEASWFGERHPDRDALLSAVDVVRAGVAAGSPQGVRARLLPASILTRGRPDPTAAAQEARNDAAAVSR